MGLFTKSNITSDEYADLLNKIVKLNNDVLLLGANVERFETRLKSFHTKLMHSRKNEDEDEDDEQPQQQTAATMQRRMLGFAD